jgi:hypothetical protein
MKANQLVEHLRFNYCFLFARNLISETLLVVGQLLITKSRRFILTLSAITLKMERKNVQYWTQIKKSVEYKISCHEEYIYSVRLVTQPQPISRLDLLLQVTATLYRYRAVIAI